jgi:hypothetical protein
MRTRTCRYWNTSKLLRVTAFSCFPGLPCRVAVPSRRSRCPVLHRTGSNMPKSRLRHYAENRVAPIRRKSDASFTAEDDNTEPSSPDRHGDTTVSSSVFARITCGDPRPENVLNPTLINTRPLSFLLHLGGRPIKHLPMLRRPLEFTQYTNERFRDLLTVHGVAFSVSRSGNGCDNAVIESFFSSLKTEAPITRNTSRVTKPVPTCSTTSNTFTLREEDPLRWATSVRLSLRDGPVWPKVRARGTGRSPDCMPSIHMWYLSYFQNVPTEIDCDALYQ